eukprot:scaffold13031_cov101-Isochrysis_galbana.AAC.4
MHPAAGASRASHNALYTGGKATPIWSDDDVRYMGAAAAEIGVSVSSRNYTVGFQAPVSGLGKRVSGPQARAIGHWVRSR